MPPMWSRAAALPMDATARSQSRSALFSVSGDPKALPSSDIQTVYMKSLEAVGFDLKQHDIRFVHDDWEAPTLGAWGLGWEVWMDGMEVTQITYFQAVGGLTLKPITRRDHLWTGTDRHVSSEGQLDLRHHVE